MRTVYWLFVVSVALFVSGIGFVIAGGRTTQVATPVDVLPVTTPVASVKQIMAAITGPSATVVYNAVSYVITADGVEDNFPQTDEEWTVIANSAAALVESGNLLLMGDRVVDNGEWVTITQALIDAGMIAIAAAEAQDVDGILDIGSAINVTCDGCHEIYLRE
jgi:hypothetical protein